MTNFDLYTIRCMTNMHVGSGNGNFGIIDNEVQRDVITGYPTINSSSLKGSIRNFLESIHDKDSVNKLLGSEENIGLYKVFSGMLLSIPFRSKNKPYYNVTCCRIIKELEELLKSVGKNLDWLNMLKDLSLDLKSRSEIDLEGLKIDKYRTIDEVNKEYKDNIVQAMGENLIIIEEEKFNKLVKELPVIARNKLDNGESKNLWYEEVVPRETRFYFGIFKDSEKNNCNIFNDISDDAKLVQIGGNATIGCGYCKINKELLGDVKNE